MIKIINMKIEGINSLVRDLIQLIYEEYKLKKQFDKNNDIKEITKEDINPEIISISSTTINDINLSNFNIDKIDKIKSINTLIAKYNDAVYTMRQIVGLIDDDTKTYYMCSFENYYSPITTVKIK